MRQKKKTNQTSFFGSVWLKLRTNMSKLVGYLSHVNIEHIQIGVFSSSLFVCSSFRDSSNCYGDLKRK